MSELAILGGGAIADCIARDNSRVIRYHDPFTELSSKYILVCKGYRLSAFDNDNQMINQSKYLNCDIVQSVQDKNPNSSIIFLSSYFVYQGSESTDETYVSWPDNIPQNASMYTKHKLEGEFLNGSGFNLRIGKFIDFKGKECRTFKLLGEEELTVDRIKFPYCSSVYLLKVLEMIIKGVINKGTYNCCDGVTSYYALAHKYCQENTKINVVDRFHRFDDYTDITINAEKLDWEMRFG